MLSHLQRHVAINEPCVKLWTALKRKSDLRCSWHTQHVCSPTPLQKLLKHLESHLESHFELVQGRVGLVLTVIGKETDWAIWDIKWTDMFHIPPQVWIDKSTFQNGIISCLDLKINPLASFHFVWEFSLKVQCTWNVGTAKMEASAVVKEFST